MELWEPLEPAVRIEKSKSEIQELAKDLGVTYKEMKEALDCDKDAEVWKNYIYTVLKHTHEDMVWLSIRRNDRKPVTDWRHKQLIKNQLVGEECEGMELYPAESRLVDTANQYHLWCSTTPGFRFPVGFNSRVVFDKEVRGTQQRKFGE